MRVLITKFQLKPLTLDVDYTLIKLFFSSYEQFKVDATIDDGLIKLNGVRYRWIIKPSTCLFILCLAIFICFG